MAQSKRHQRKEIFDQVLDRLIEELPLRSDDHDPQQRASLVSVILAFRNLGKWLADIEMRLQILEDYTFVVGWDAIADFLSVSKRTLQRKKQQLLDDGIIQEAWMGNPRRKRIVASLIALVLYKQRISPKT